MKPSEYFKKLDLGALDSMTAQFIREKIYTFKNVDLLEGTKEFEILQQKIESDFPLALGIQPKVAVAPPAKKKVEPVKVEPVKVVAKVSVSEKKKKIEELTNLISDTKEMIELTEMTLVANPNDVESQDMLELNKMTLEKAQSDLEEANKMADGGALDGKYVYKFHEERGEISAYVVDLSNDKMVWEFHYPDWTLSEEERLTESTLVDDGFMKHWEDISGLENYLKDLSILPADAELVSEQEAESFAKGGEIIKTKFNSHENHNPEYDILEGHLDGDSFITYAVKVKGDNVGKESMEYYSGENFVVGSKKKSFSRHYESNQIPERYKASWLKLKELYETKKYYKGGAIKNQYKGKSETEIWMDWTVEQRTHFLTDHAERINELHKKETTNTEINATEWATYLYFELPKAIKEALKEHISEGEYEKGGGVEGKDLLPPVMKYSEYLELASSKFGITKDEARSKYGQYTIGQWENLLSGDVGSDEVQITLTKEGDEIKYKGSYKGIEFEGEGEFDANDEDGSFKKIESEFEAKGTKIDKEAMLKIRAKLIEELGKVGVYFKNGGKVGVSKANDGTKGKFVWTQEQGGISKGVFSQSSFEEIFKEIENDKNFKLTTDDESLKVFKRDSDGYTITFRLQNIFKDGGDVDVELMGATQNGNPKPSGLFFVRFENGKKSVIVKDEKGNLERYVKSPNFAGYHLIVDGVDYEFANSVGFLNSKGGGVNSVDLELEKWVALDKVGKFKNSAEKSWYEGTLDKLMDKYELSDEEGNLGSDLAAILKKQKSGTSKKVVKVSKKKFFKEAVEAKKPDTLGGWSKDIITTKRRRLAIASRDKSLKMKERYLSAARALKALANVTKDAKTKKIASNDAKYFFNKAK